MQRIILKQFSTAFLLIVFLLAQSLVAQEIPVVKGDAERVIKQYEQGNLTNPTFAEKQIISDYLDSWQTPYTISQKQNPAPEATFFLQEAFTGQVLPTGWTNVDNGTSGIVWQFTDPGGRAPGGNFDADFTIMDSDFAGSGSTLNATLTTLAVDCNTATTVTLGFDNYFNNLTPGTDYGIVEISNDGTTWTQVDSISSDIIPPVYTEYDVTSVAAGQSTVYVRWTYNDAGSWAWWWAIDNVVIYEPDAIPLPAVVVNPLDAETDVSPYTTLDWVAGGGSAPTGYRLYFGTDGGGITLPTSIENNTDLGLVTQYTPTSALTFGTTYYWSLVPYNLAGDATGNPIWSFTVLTPYPQPYSEDFNAGTADGWLTTGWSLYSTHGVGGTYAIAENYWSAAPASWVQTPFVGPLTATSQLEFDYRIVNYSGYPGTATVLDADYFDVQISTDGGTTFTTIATIDSGNHVTSTSYATLIFDLGTSYSGQSVIFRLDGYWAAGDYYFDMDNVKIRETPAVVNPAVVVNPLDAATGVSILTTLDWASGGGAPETGYRINFGTDNPPTNLENDTDLGLVTTYTPASALVYSTTYYWEIIPYNASGDATGTVIWSFTTEADPTITTFPWNDDLENPGAPGTAVGWYQDPGDDFDWTFDAGGTTSSGTGPSVDHNPGTSLGTYAYTETSGNNNTTGNIWTPPFDVSGLTSPEFSFWYHMYGATMGTLNVDYSTDNGATWTNAWTLSGDQGDVWYKGLFALPTNADRVRFSGLTGTSFTSDMAFDDVTIQEAPACSEPTGLALSNVTSTSADIGWADAATVEIDYGPPGHVAGTGTIVPGVTANPYTLGSLTPNTAYDVFVRQDCGIAGYSTWVGPLNFITAQIAATIPFSEDFETWPNNWTVVNGVQKNQWWVGTAAVPYAGTNSAFVSPDSGLTYGYDGTVSSVSHLYRDIAFTGSTGGGYDVKFWWKGDGETVAWDHLRVFLVDPSVAPTAGIELSVGQVGDANYNGQPTYIEATITVPDSLTGTTARLVFQWKNDGSVTGATSASIDDISVDVVVPGILNGTITDCLSTNPLELAVVTAGSFSTTTNASGFYEFPAIPPGTYDVTASITGYASTTVPGVVVTSSVTTTQDICLDEVLLPPVNLQASVTGQDVNLTWVAPPDYILRWDSGVNGNAIGLTAGGTFETSSRFPASVTAPITGAELREVEIFINDSVTNCTIKIYDQGTATSPGTLLHSEDVTSSIVAYSFNNITLSTPVTITGNDIWIGYEVTHAAGLFPAGTDPGPATAEGDWIYPVPGWEHLANLGLNYNWNIAGFVYNTTSDGPVTVTTLATNDYKTNESSKLKKKDTGLLKSGSAKTLFNDMEVKPGYQIESIYPSYRFTENGVLDATLTGYNVYRDDTLEVASDVTNLFYNDMVVPYGLHSYNVTAVYVEGESGPSNTVDVDVVNPNLDTIYVYPMSANYWTGSTDGVTKTDTSEVRCMDIEHGWMMFDVTAIPDDAIINKIRFFGYANAANWPYWSATPLAGIDPLTATASDLYAAADTNSGSGTAYIYSNEGSGFAVGWHDYLMETWANTDLEAALAQDWFAMGMATRDYSLTYFVNWDGWAEANVPYLEVVYEVAGSTFPLTVNVADGWNMVSVPGTNPAGMGVTTWWSGKDPAASVFKYSGGYLPVTTTAPTEGYWMKNSGAQVYSYPAIDIVTHTDISAALGWNMIGGYENTVPVGALFTTPPGQITGTIFEYSGGYNPATDIVPGYGYWVKTLSACLIGGLSAPPLGKVSNPVAEYIQEDWGKIIITDNAGVSYTLYAVNGEVDLNQYELPPAPPAGMFDIRFGSDRIAEDISSSTQSIDMSGIQYPITVSVEGMDIRVQDESGNEIDENVKSGDQITISNSQINKLMVSGELIPDVYALEQNYPNPFNPSTVIEFSLPEDVAEVNLTIYDVLGQRVAQLVNTSLKAGKYTYQWDASRVASGMYIYELRANKFVSVKKMMFLK